jgi:hypothetical protein
MNAIGLMAISHAKIRSSLNIPSRIRAAVRGQKRV